MFSNMENLKIISSLHRKNKYTDHTVINRATHSFLIRIHGSIIYDFYDQKFQANEGDMIFIPQGSTYSYHCITPAPLYTSINFTADLPNPKVAVYSLKDFFETERLITTFSDMWNLGTQTERFSCLSLFYNLLAYLSAAENTTYSAKRLFKTIEPAIMYLRENIYDSTLNVNKLHRLCGISDTYFRELFKTTFAMTPQKYIASKRLAHAKSVLDSGDFSSIQEVALSAGYSDPLYFSKAFKKMYGITPSALKR